MMRLLLGLLAMLLPLGAAAEEKLATLMVHGDAVVRFAPDEVTLPVTVRVEDASLPAAKKRHDEKLRAVLDLALQAGVPRERLQTDRTSVLPLYDYARDSTRPRLRGYQVETEVSLRLSDFAALAPLMEAMVNAGVDTIGNVTYSLHDEEKAKEEALAEAMDHAHAKAERLAQSAKVTFDRPWTIEESPPEIARPFPRPLRMSAKMPGIMASPAPPDLPSGRIEIRQEVVVTYRLK